MRLLIVFFLQSFARGCGHRSWLRRRRGMQQRIHSFEANGKIHSLWIQQCRYRWNQEFLLRCAIRKSNKLGFLFILFWEIRNGFLVLRREIFAKGDSFARRLRMTCTIFKPPWKAHEKRRWTLKKISTAFTCCLKKFRFSKVVWITVASSW